MTTFYQAHFITANGPNCMNADDLGRPKGAIVGGAPRMRISSQAQKRAWRTSDLFTQRMHEHMAVRTRLIGAEIIQAALAAGAPADQVAARVRPIVRAFGNIADDASLETAQLVMISPGERAEARRLAALVATGEYTPTTADLAGILGARGAVDIALSGRMMTDGKKDETDAAVARRHHCVEAAMKVAHAISVHRAEPEADPFTALDDRKARWDSGAAMMDTAQFISGVTYHYVVIDGDLLHANLEGNAALARQAIQTIIETALTVSPKGKISAFASYAWASYALLEVGTATPRSLVSAFLEPIKGTGVLTEAISRLEETRAGFDAVMGGATTDSAFFNAQTKTGTLADLLALVK